MDRDEGRPLGGEPSPAQAADPARTAFADDATMCTRSELAVGLLFVGIVTLIFFAPLLTGKTLSNIPSTQELSAPWQIAKPLYVYPQADQAFSTYPSTVLMTHAWRAGTVPLWNPFNLGGVPLLANGGAGVLYPFGILLDLTVSPLAHHDIFLVTHVFATGIFMFLFMKELRLHLLAALLGAVGWMFASWNSSFMQLETTLPITALLPAALWLIHRSSRTRSWRTALAAGAPLGLMALGGQLGLAGVAFAICGAYSAALAFAPAPSHAQTVERIHPRQRRLAPQFDPRRLVQTVLTLGTGSALGAAAILPTALNGLAQQGRTAVSYSNFVRNYTIPVAEFTHVFSGGPPVGFTLLRSGVFVGLVPLFLAFVGVLCRRPGASLGRWLAVGTFLFAVGVPPATWLGYHLIPTISRLSGVGYVLWAFDLGVVILAAVGLHALLEWSTRVPRRLRWRRLDLARVTPAAAALLAVVAVGTTAWQLLDYARYINPPFTAQRRQSLFPVTPAIAAVQRDKARRGSVNPQRLIGFKALAPSENLVFAFEDADGYDSVASNRVRNLWRVVEGSSVDDALRFQKFLLAVGLKSGISGSFRTQFNSTTTRFDLLPRVGVTTVVASPADSLLLAAQPPAAPFRLKPVYVGHDGSVYDVGGTQPRAWVVHQTDVVRTETDALRRFTDPSFDYRGRMVVEPDQGIAAAGQVARRGVGPGTVAKRDPIAINGTAFTVQTQSPGWLVMADMDAPGWHVTVNGRESRLLRADYALQAVAVPAGRSRVVLKYRPPGFTGALATSGLATVVLLGTGLLALRARRRRTNGPAIASTPGSTHAEPPRA